MIEKPNVRFHDGQILSEEPLNKAMVAVDDCVDAANDSATKANTAETAATNAQTSASAAAASSSAIQAALEEIKGSGDIPAATVVKVAEHTTQINDLGSKVDDVLGSEGGEKSYDYTSANFHAGNGYSVVDGKVVEGSGVTSVSYYKVPVKKGDVVSHIGRITKTVANPRIVTDSSLNVLESFPVTATISSGSFDITNEDAAWAFILHVPTTGYEDNTTSVSVTTPATDGKIDLLQKDVNTLNDNVFAYEIGEMIAAYSKPNNCIAVTGDLAELNVMSLWCVKVKKDDVIKITISGGVGSARGWALYDTDDFDALNSSTVVAGTIGGMLKTLDGTHNVVMPNDGIFAISKYESTSYSIIGKVDKGLAKRVEALEKQGNSKSVEYSITDSSIKVAYAIGDQKLVVTMLKRGGNNIFDFGQLANIGIDETIGKSTPESLVNISTDWHAPFTIAAKNNINGDAVDSHHFTGGNHNYNNAGTGDFSATGRTSSIAFFADGKQVSSGNGCANTISVKWVNYIQAYNTKKVDGSGREVLKEFHTLVFDGHSMNEEVELVPLEDVMMEIYYGFQLSRRDVISPNINYIGGANRGTYTDTTPSGNYNPDGIVAFGDTYKLKMFVDRSYDIGDGSLFDTADSTGAFVTNNKAYMNLIKNKELSANSHYYFRGGWEFGKLMNL